MTPLAEDRKQIGWRFPRVCQQELEPVGGRGLLGRQAVAAVVIFYQHPKQVHRLVFSRGPGALAEQIAKARTDQIVLLVVLDARRHRLSEQLFIGNVRPRSAEGKVRLRAGKDGRSAPRAISRSRCNGLRAAAYLGAAVKAEAEAGTH